jgi:hypothetical protein
MSTQPSQSKHKNVLRILKRTIPVYLLNHKMLVGLTAALIIILSFLSIPTLNGSGRILKTYPSGATLNLSGDFSFFQDAVAKTKATGLYFGNISIGDNYLTVYAKNLSNINITLNFNITRKTRPLLTM